MSRKLKLKTTSRPAQIVVFKDKSGRWNYCPKIFRILFPVFDIGDGENGFDTAGACLEAATNDRTIPTGSLITVEEA